jgi:hypothetical protein
VPTTSFQSLTIKIWEQMAGEWEQYGNTSCSLHRQLLGGAIEEHIDRLALRDALLVHSCVGILLRSSVERYET